MNKRLILMVVLVLSVLTGTAQVANRSGVFVEAGIGGLFGNTLINESKSSESVNGNVTVTTKAGVSYDAMVGYRWAFSPNWALDGRVGFENPGRPLFDIMPGIRYTTNDVVANRSLFFQANVGISLAIENNFYFNETVSPVFQLQAGVNITNHLYAGIYYLAHFMSYKGIYDMGYYDFDDIGFDATRNFGTMGLRLGYRF